MSSLHQGFQATDQPSDTEAIFGWLDRMNGSPLIQQVKRQMLDVCPVGEGDQVLDVGCGLGHEVFHLAERVGPQRRVVGIDANSAMITEARRRATDLTLPITFEIGDVRHVDFPDNTFDLCRTERVLRYLDRPEAALGEMARLARPGGFVLAFDFDSDQTVVDAPDPALTRRIAEVLDAAVPHPWIGRQLFGLFRRAGLRDVRVVPHVLCLSGGGRLVGSAEAGGRDGDILHGGSRIHSRRLQTVAKGRAGHGLLRDHRPWRDVSHGGSVTVAAGHVPRRPGR